MALPGGGKHHACIFLTLPPGGVLQVERLAYRAEHQTHRAAWLLETDRSSSPALAPGDGLHRGLCLIRRGGISTLNSGPFTRSPSAVTPTIRNVMISGSPG